MFGNVWGLRNLDDETRRHSSFTKEDNRRLQVLQNQVLRMKTGLGRDTPTDTLTRESQQLSVQQLTAYHTLVTVFKAVRLGKPSYLANKLKLRRSNGTDIFPLRQTNTINVKADLTLSRGGMVYRGAKLWNLLDHRLRAEPKLEPFKTRIKKWIRENVPVKPP